MRWQAIKYDNQTFVGQLVGLLSHAYIQGQFSTDLNVFLKHSVLYGASTLISCLNLILHVVLKSLYVTIL